MFQIIRDNEHLAFARTLEDARQAVEDDAVSIWDRLRDPNTADAQVYPGLEWSEPDGSVLMDDPAWSLLAWFEFDRAHVEYQIVDPTPFAAWGAVNAGVLEPPLADAICITYDNKGCDYPYSQELLIWLV